MMKNKKAEATIGLTGSEVAKLVIAIAAILILIYLGWILTNFYFNRTQVQKAEAELGEIVPLLEDVAATGQEKEYFVLHAPQWYLFSSEFSDLCDGRFCLCLCEERECSDVKTRGCVQTEKFVLIRENGKEKRAIQIKEPPSKLYLKYIDEQAYPYTQSDNIDKGWFSVKQSNPIFYQFTDQWRWSFDLENWMTPDKTKSNDGRRPFQDNVDFINEIVNSEFYRYNEEEVIRIFSRNGGKISDGIYVIEK